MTYKEEGYDYNELLIDGDLLIFSTCAAIEYGKEPSECNFDDIARTIDSRIVGMKRRLNAKSVRVFLSGKDNFRFVCHPGYKSNRANAWRPYNLPNAQGYVRSVYDAETVDGLEADDLVCMYQKMDGSTIIATIDKDIPQVRGMHFRWETQHRGEKIFKVEGHGELACNVKVSESGKEKKEVKGNGVRFFCWQLLVGDPTDGIIGCGIQVDKVYKTGKKAGIAYQAREGVGAVAAYELLKHAISYPKCMGIVIAQYKQRFGDEWEKYLLMYGRCLFMVNKRVGDKVQLWHFDSSKFKDSWYDLKEQKIVRFEG